MSTLTARPPLRPSPTWQLSVIVVLAVSAGDAAGGIVTTAATDTLGGMWQPSSTGITSVFLLAVTLAGQAAVHHAVRTGRHRPLRLCLTVLVAWYSGCTAALISASLLYGQLLDAGPIGFAALLAAAACWTSRAAGRQFGGD